MAVPQRTHSTSEHSILNKFSHIKSHIGEWLALSIPCSQVHRTLRNKFHEITNCSNG